MNALKYKRNDKIELDFGLNIEGTSYQPSEVRIMFSHGEKMYGTPAILNGELYNAEFDLGTIPDLEDNANLQLAVEVIMNGRVFRPLKRQLMIIDYYDQAQEPVNPTYQEINPTFQEINVDPVIKEDQRDTLWIKDILTGTGIPPAIEVPFSDTLKNILHPKKLKIKFDKKPKTVAKNKQIEPMVMPDMKEIEFNDKINKKTIKKRKESVPFKITEENIVYL